MKKYILIFMLTLLGATTAFANAPLGQGSITVHTRMASDESNPLGSGVAMRNVPLRAERVELIDPNNPPTESQLRDPAWIEANTRSLNNSFEGITNAQGYFTFLNLDQGIWRISQTDGSPGAPNPIPVDQRFDTFLVGIPTHMEDGEFRLDVVVYPKVDREELQDASMSIIEHYDNVYVVEFSANIPNMLFAAEFLDTYLILNQDKSTEVDFVFGWANYTNGEYLHLQNGQHFASSIHNVSGFDVLRVRLLQEGIEALSQPNVDQNGRFHFGVILTHDGYQATANGNRNVFVGEALMRYNPMDNFDIENPTANAIANEQAWNTNIDGVRLNTDFDTFILEVANLTVGGRQGIANTQFSVFREITDSDCWVNPVMIDNELRCLISLTHEEEFTGTTDMNGIVRFHGLNSISVAEDTQTFWIQQQSVREGYRMIDEWIEVEVSENTTSVRNEDNTIQLSQDSNVVLINIYNELDAGWILPETGATGVIIFTIIGTSLIIYAVLTHRKNEQ